MTTETKFTPGPWKVWSDDEVYSDSGGEKLVVVPDSACGRDVYGTDMVSRDESKRNAHLIAAAPDLYEALEEIEEAARQVMEGVMSISSLDVERRKAIAALAKARGES